MRFIFKPGRLIVLVLVLSLGSSAFQCSGGANFALGLRSALAASPALVASLPISADKKALTASFTQMADKTLVLADDLKVCSGAKPCQLDAVERYSTAIETILARPEFGNIPKLDVITGIIRGIIASARIYYGGAGSSDSRVGPVTEKSIKLQIENLKREMQP